MHLKGRVLVVAGSDSSARTGMQADLKTIMALGGYALTAVTALTARDTRGVVEFFPVPPAFVQRQMRLALYDIGVDVVHCGMLYSAEMINCVADVIDEMAKDVPLVLDPIMVFKDGRSVLDHEGLRYLKIRLLPRATVLTPNIREAELLAGMRIRDIDERRHAASMMLTLGAQSVLLTGGHMLESEPIIDLLATEARTVLLYSDYLNTRHTAGVGSTLSAGIAVGLAQGMSISDAVVRARHFVQDAMADAPGFGLGQGPINHAVGITDYRAGVKS